MSRSTTTPHKFATTVGIDPGSKKTGVSIWKGTDLAWWGVITIPSKHKGPAAGVLMGQTVRKILGEKIPVNSRLMIEIPGKQFGRQAGGVGLITLGSAVGAIILAMSDHWEPELVEVQAWVRFGGFKLLNKQTRAGIVAKRFAGQYQPSRDPGMDGADAIGIVANDFGLVNAPPARKKK